METLCLATLYLTKTLTMPKLCLNSRDDLIILNLDHVAFFQANGNYTQLTYISGQKQLLTIGLSKVRR